MEQLQELSAPSLQTAAVHNVTDAKVCADLNSRLFATRQHAIDAVQTYAASAGFKVYCKSKQRSPPLFWIICHCAGKPPRKRSETHPEAQRRAVASTCIKCECKWLVKLRQQSVSKEQHTAPDENSCQNASHEYEYVIFHTDSMSV
ncbi:hypothetical protein JKP88DRAFT_253391 [Tribonema minus]|uniref:Uncharacterized protein n=1 Tax=Tribonema minus TaxID=303371 RepID=A0A835Z8X5_9STRA|nr:hypothetical protein JKP88DRAFT_253391 [Tribonema minus]